MTAALLSVDALHLTERVAQNPSPLPLALAALLGAFSGSLIAYALIGFYRRRR